jgi:predicted molibdopterin-dependent oxidoreductase YjgC
MCADIKSFNNIKLESLLKESFLINKYFDPKFNFVADKNIDNNNLIRLYKGRVLVKENDVVDIERDGDSNIVKENIVFNVSEDILEKYKLKIGDNINLKYGTDKTEVSGKVISELNLSNTISITNLFGEMAREMQNSKNKDWSMDIPVLDYELVSLKK